MPDEQQQTGSTVAVDVWNRALDRIGQTKPIAGPEEASLAATVCRRHYYDALDEALELRDWDFARKQARLAQVEHDVVGWTYAYALPDDFVAARGLIIGGDRLSLEGDDRTPHEVQAGDEEGGLILLCDVVLDPTTDRLLYTRRHDTVAKWPRLFLSAVVYRLAAELALAIVKGREGGALAKELLAYFDQGLRVAHATRANQRFDHDPVTPSLKARE